MKPLSLFYSLKYSKSLAQTLVHSTHSVVFVEQMNQIDGIYLLYWQSALTKAPTLSASSGYHP